MSAEVILLSPLHSSPFVLLSVKPRSPHPGLSSPRSRGLLTPRCLLLLTAYPRPSPLYSSDPSSVLWHHTCVREVSSARRVLSPDGCTSCSLTSSRLSSNSTLTESHIVENAAHPSLLPPYPAVYFLRGLSTNYSHPWVSVGD